VLPDEPFAGPERATLAGFLDRYRASLLLRCSGLSAVQLAERSVPPSPLSLIGIVRHLTDVERTLFRVRWRGADVPSWYATPDRPDAAFDDATAEHARRDLKRLVTEQDLTRRAVADLSLEATYISPRWGEMSLRWAMMHMVGEYAAHTGQADLIRERIDGRTGWQA
jgi:hypothetical protein